MLECIVPDTAGPGSAGGQDRTRVRKVLRRAGVVRSGRYRAPRNGLGPPRPFRTRGASSGESRRPRRLYGVGADSEAPALDGRRADTHRSGPPHQSGTLEPQPDEKETQYLEQTNDVRPDL